jgi:hypothetical protein
MKAVVIYESMYGKLTRDPGAGGDGVREWLDSLGEDLGTLVAQFARRSSDAR